MLSKHSKLVLLLFMLFFILGCFSEPNSTPTPTSPPKDNKNFVTIPQDCYREGYEIYISVNKDFCFAYPAGYHITRQSKPEKLELRYALAQPPLNPSIEDIEAMQQVEPVHVSLTIQRETHADLKLEDFAIEKRPEGDTTEPLPWSVHDKPALMRREIIQEADSKKVSYFVYIKRGNTYYQLGFCSLALISDQGASGTELENFFFLVLDTFTFID